MEKLQILSQMLVQGQRRNGKLWSCEPCRLAKTACDHVQPVCGRCSRQKKPSSCLYHPNPLSKRRRTDGDQVERRISHRIYAPANNYATVSPTSQDTFQAITPSTSGPETLESLAHQNANAGRFVPSSREAVGFLGSTSFSSVFTDVADHVDHLEDNIASLEETQLRADPLQCQKGAEVLALLLKELPAYQKKIAHMNQIWEGALTSRRLLHIWTEEINKAFGELVGLPDTDPQWQAASNMVLCNTREPGSVDSSTSMEEWARSISGKGLKWEVVGLILLATGLTAFEIEHWERIFTAKDGYASRSKFLSRIKTAAEICITFCNNCESMNEVFLMLLIRDACFLECIKGDTSYVAWKRNGDVADTLIAMGIHRASDVTSIPIWLHEIRKQLFAISYCRDKTASFLLGRPPRLMSNFCTTDMPLDISNDEIMLPVHELKQIISNIGERGWNSENAVNLTSWMRIRLQYSRIREEILGIALGNNHFGQSLEGLVGYIRQSLGNLQASVPKKVSMALNAVKERIRRERVVVLGLPRTPTSGSMLVEHSGDAFQLFTYGGLLQTELLFQRALVTRKLRDRTALIPMAHQILDLVVTAVSSKHFFDDSCAAESTKEHPVWSRNIETYAAFLLAAQGLPSAGVIAIELLRRQQATEQPSFDWPCQRSETIQMLFAFITALGYVGVSHGNHAVCRKYQTSLRRILDQILEPPSVQTINTPRYENTGENELMPGRGDFLFPTDNNIDFLEWLEKFD